MGEGNMKLSRRAFLTAAAGTAASVGVGSASAASLQSSQYSGVIKTRDHFDITWYGDVERTNGEGRTSYDLAQEVPGLTDDASPEELIVFVHGWAHDPVRARKKFRQVTTALRGEGVDNPVVGYSWDSNTETLQYWQADEIADLNADKLGTFIRDYQAASPDTDVRVIAHSLGARMITECLEFFMDRGYDTSIKSVDLLGGAIEDDKVAVGAEYGEAIPDHCENFRNYYKTDDETLKGQWRAAFWDTAVGHQGIEGDAPSNYEEYDVTYVTEHDDYPKPDGGCIPDVVDNWE